MLSTDNVDSDTMTGGWARLSAPSEALPPVEFVELPCDKPVPVELPDTLTPDAPPPILPTLLALALAPFISPPDVVAALPEAPDRVVGAAPEIVETTHVVTQQPPSLLSPSSRSASRRSRRSSDRLPLAVEVEVVAVVAEVAPLESLVWYPPISDTCVTPTWVVPPVVAEDVAEVVARTAPELPLPVLPPEVEVEVAEQVHVVVWIHVVDTPPPESDPLLPPFPPPPDAFVAVADIATAVPDPPHE